MTASDVLNSETFTISGLSLAASTTATLGDVTATVAGAGGAGTAFTCYTTGVTTATGLVAVGVGTGSTSIIINYDNCHFEPTDTSDLIPAALVFGTGGTAESRNITAVVQDFPAVGQDTLTIQATTTAHPVDQVVSQASVETCTSALLTGLGTVRDSLVYNAPASVQLLFPGEANQGPTTGVPIADLTATERTAGFLSVGTVITFTITTPGVTFSSGAGRLPVILGSGTLTVGATSLSADRMSASATVSTASGGIVDPTITLDNIHYDVASTVTSGTAVNVTLALTGAKVVVPTSRSNAQVGRIFTASAPTPTVNIGQNNQPSGLITIVEVTAGSFTDGSGSNNVFEICPADGFTVFSVPGPWAKVMNTDAGALRLREGSVASPDNVVQGTADPNAPGCFYWTVFTKSTVASTVVIGNADFTSGPLVNVAFGAPAGPLNATLAAGRLDDPATVPNERTMTVQVTLAIANRGFASQVKVTALGQPIMAPGSTHNLAGNIEVAETGNGQLKLGERICVEILPNANTNVIQDVFMSNTTTADLPVATATGGTLIGPVTASSAGCASTGGGFGLPGATTMSFSFVVAQQSTSGAGKVTISNIHYNVVNDASTGPVQVNVWGFTFGANVDFQRVISNARVGSPLAGTASTRLGVTQVGAFTTSTKVTQHGKYVTYRFDFGVGAAGAHVEIWGATKTGNDWSGFAKVTSRVANASGVVYYYIRQNSATWKSYRGFWAGGGAWTPARQARWL
jgi:hypothetical protein